MGLATEALANALVAGVSEIEHPTVRRHIESLALFIRTYGEPAINASLAYAWIEGYETGSGTAYQWQAIQIRAIIRAAIEHASAGA
jgi:hypothetical protein